MSSAGAVACHSSSDLQIRSSHSFLKPHQCVTNANAVGSGRCSSLHSTGVHSLQDELGGGATLHACVAAAQAQTHTHTQTHGEQTAQSVALALCAPANLRVDPAMASGPTVGVMTIALLWSVLATSPSSATMSRGAAWPAFEGGGLADATVLKPSKMGRNLSLLEGDTKPTKQCIKSSGCVTATERCDRTDDTYESNACSSWERTYVA